MDESRPVRRAELGIWAYAFGYFAAYAPYSALTKLASQGTIPGMKRAVDGFELLPITTASSLVGMIAFLSVSGWWRHAGRRTILGRSVPFPGPWTGLSGLATAAIIATTTLAYTFSGVSIVFMMLLMRGGVLVMAPVVDAVSGRKVRGASWIALGLSLAALVVALGNDGRPAITFVAGADVAIYLLGYFIRLRFMSRTAKSEDRSQSIRYFVEEQMVATPAIFGFLVVLALVGQGSMMMAVRAGFTNIWSSGSVAAGIVIGILSQGTGVFGALVLLDGRENAFCVPVNRASSVLAGVLASVSLAVLGLGKRTATPELLGAAMVLGAIVVLAWPTKKPAAA
ncbi:MAG: hypothetical protein JST00_36395 [Deltaproteobacteria bacterium]|nr:hypothetical protein [Deltaproteobacteria bacterium]